MSKITAQYDYSDAEMLALVKEAIVKLLAGGQQYAIAGNNFTRADLDKLRAMRKELEQSIAEEQGQGLVFGKIERRRAR